MPTGKELAEVTNNSKASSKATKKKSDDGPLTDLSLKNGNRKSTLLVSHVYFSILNDIFEINLT